MLTKIGKIVEKKPGLIIGLIILITIGFGTLLPFLEMETSMENFLPDDEIVNANTRVNEYFGSDQEILMIYVEKQKADNAITPDALKEEYLVAKELEKADHVQGSVSVAGFVNIVCGLEFGKGLLNCSDEEINTAFEDLLAKQNSDEIKMMDNDDGDEAIDYDPYPIIPGGKSENSLDIKNYYMQVDNDTVIFSIEVYDLSHFGTALKPPFQSINVMEWYIDFKNLIIPDVQMDIDFRIAAHIEPKTIVWEIGNGTLKNIGGIIELVRNRELFNSFSKEVYLWMKPPGQDMYFPIPLETGNVTFDTNENRINIEVSREELGNFGIAPKIETIELPARLNGQKAGVRYYQASRIMKRWSRIGVNAGFIQEFIEKIENKPLLKSITTKILNKSGDLTWEELTTLFSALDENDVLTLKDFDSGWVVLDEAPDEGVSDKTIFIKPFFMEELQSLVRTFLSKDYSANSGPSATMIMIMINGSIDQTELGDISGTLVNLIEETDEEMNYVTMSATGNGVINYQINDMTMEANTIIGPAIFIVISIILFLTFKKLSYMLLPLVGLTISIIWLFGTMVLLGISFNTIAVALIPLLMGLGVDYSVHLFHNYRAELQKGKTYGQAIVASIQDIGIAMFLATITTVIAFLSFLSASIPPLRDFGILCALGIIYTFIVTITLQAAVRYKLDKKKKAVMKPNSKRISLNYSMGKTSAIVCRHPKSILFVAAVITIVMGIGALQVPTGFNMQDFLPGDNPAINTMEAITENFPYASQQQEYILIEGDVASVETLDGIYSTFENLRDDKFVSQTPDGDPKVTSILSIIQDSVRENSTIATMFNIGQDGVPQSDIDVKQLFDYLYESDEYGADVKQVLYRDEKRYEATVIRVYTDISNFGNGDGDTGKEMESLYNDLNEDITSYGNANPIVTGYTVLMYTITSSLTDSQIISTVISVILSAFVLMIAYKKPVLGLIAMIPVSISVIWIIGTMYFIGYSLNIMTIMVTSLTIGLGITYAIHAVERFRLTADKTGDVIEAVSETVGHTGGALLVAAITTIAGFGMLMLAPIPPEQQFGLVTAMTILYSFLTTIFVLPPLLIYWGRWRKKKKGFIISSNKK